MTKKIIFVFLLFLAFSTTGAYVYLKSKFQPPPNQLVLPEKSVDINFEWINGNKSNQSAILIPVQLEEIPHTFYMQFDLGAPYSVLYYSAVEGIREKYPDFETDERDGRPFVKRLNFKIDSIPVIAETMLVVPSGAGQKNIFDSTQITIIGTVGADLIENKAMVLNYPERKISIGNTIPEKWFTDAIFTPFKFKGRRIVLPAIIEGDEERIMFDTGSSNYSLLTNRRKWNKLATNETKVLLDTVNAWGNPIITYNAFTDATITLGGIKMPLEKVTYVEGMSVMQKVLMRFSGLTGMTGNQLFKDKVLLLDTRKLRFAVVR